MGGVKTRRVAVATRQAVKEDQARVFYRDVDRIVEAMFYEEMKPAILRARAALGLETK